MPGELAWSDHQCWSTNVSRAPRVAGNPADVAAMRREEIAPGKYERVKPHHSWNASQRVTNWFLFNLQRHSDHHAWAKRRYQVLRHHEIAPQLPAGYAAMVVLAMIPPLWKKVMNPRVEAYYEGEEHQLA